MPKRERKVRFHDHEIDRLREAMVAEGLEELPLAAYVMRLVERHERQRALVSPDGER